MKNLFFTIFFNMICFVCHAQYDVNWNTCILFCTDAKSADEAKFENQRDQCRQGCYCVVAIGMTDITVVSTSSKLVVIDFQSFKYR